MDKSLPNDIRNLPTYVVSMELFVCTCVLLFIFTISALIFFIIWIYRSFKNYYNPIYIVSYEDRLRFQSPAQQRQRQSQHSNEDQQHGKFTAQLQTKSIRWNEIERRMLQFFCLSVIIAININTFTSKIMLTVAYIVSLVLFLAFNIFRIKETFHDNRFLRMLFLLPLIVCYISYYIFSNGLEEK